MTVHFKDVYITFTATVTGPYEKEGPLGKYFDKSYDDMYFGEKTFEEAEAKLIKDAIKIVLFKAKENIDNVDLILASDLSNQQATSYYALKDINTPCIGLYSACSSSVLELFLGALVIENNYANKVIAVTSSHNCAAEKQFRYPIEYGFSKPKRSTFTATGAAAAFLSKDGDIKIESVTVGSVLDANIKDPFNMGGVMAKAAAYTLYKHLTETKRKASYYDLILTGDLGIYGKEILKQYMLDNYKIKLNNYDDAGTMLYNDNQNVNAGASGPVCAPLVLCTKVFKKMKNRKLHKVLLIATGALHSQTSTSQKRTIPSIAHAISLEVL